MGADTFTTTAKGKTAAEAFEAARNEALYDYGHRGYTGSIAEKRDFVMIAVPNAFVVDDGRNRAHAYADALIADDDARIVNKWGPAGCIALPDGEFLFFGWASS